MDDNCFLGQKNDLTSLNQQHMALAVSTAVVSACVIVASSKRLSELRLVVHSIFSAASSILSDDWIT